MKYLLDGIASAQFGLVSRKQVLEVVAESTLRSMLKRGELVSMRAGVYRFRGAPLGWESGLWHALLRIDGAVVSHRAAARVWGLDCWNDAEPEVTAVTSNTYGPMEGVTVHRTKSSPSNRMVCGMPVATPERTVIDLTAVASPGQVASSLNALLTQRLLSVRSLERELDLIGSSGRWRSSVVRELIEERREDAAVVSGLHRRVLGWLREQGIDGWVTELPVIVHGRRRYLDIAWPNLHVAIEADGFAFHGDRTTFDDDRRRNNGLIGQGWTVLHVTTNTPKDELLDQLRSAIRQAQAG